MPNSQHDGLANRWFQPLTHVSGSQQRAGPIAALMEGGKGLRAAARGCRGNSLGRNSDSPRRAAIAGSARCDSREARQASGDRQLMMAVTQILRKKLVRTVQTLAALALVMGHSAGLAQGSAPIDGDLAAPTTAAPPPTNPAPPVSSAPKTPSASATAAAPGPSIDIGAPLNDAIPADAPTHGTNTYQKDDLIGAAEGVFGKGAAGLATMISDLLEKAGRAQRLYRRARGERRFHSRVALWLGHAAPQDRRHAPSLLDGAIGGHRCRRERGQQLCSGLQPV